LIGGRRILITNQSSRVLGTEQAPGKPHTHTRKTSGGLPQKEKICPKTFVSTSFFFFQSVLSKFFLFQIVIPNYSAQVSHGRHWRLAINVLRREK
jgi:hypothetical protein